MKPSTPWHFSERSQIMAAVMLTDDPRVKVSRAPKGGGLDLLVTYSKGRAKERVFGVQAWGALHASEMLTRDGAIRRPILREMMEGAAGSPFPVAAMLFEMSTDTGYFAWLPANTKKAGGKAAAPRETSPIPAEKFTDDLLKRILREVDEWHKAQNRKAAARKAQSAVGIR